MLRVQRGAAAAAPPYFRIFQVVANVNVAMSGFTVAGGSVPGGNGGGIYNAGALLLSRMAVSGNTASAGGDGAGIFNDYGNLTLERSTVSNNSVSDTTLGGSGGGVFNKGGRLTVTGSTISGNFAIGPGGTTDSGGGIITNVGVVNLTNSTITGNSADIGGGIRNVNGGVVNARNTIIALNASPNGPDINGPVTSQGFNIVGTFTGGTIAPAQFSDQVGVTAAQLGLGALQDNGGPTPTHALLGGSFAIDKGHSSGATTDQRGRPRVYNFDSIVNAGDGADVGAFELIGATLDIDDNREYEPLTDGLMVLRYLFGLTGAPLTINAVGTAANRSVPTDVLAYLNAIRPSLDVDGNTQIEPFTDGLMVIRYLFGLRGAALTAGALGMGATRTQPQIEAYIQSLMP